MTHRVAVYVVLRRSPEVLFLLRAGTGYRDGEYGLPSGKVEPGESLAAAVRRELAEETGLVVFDDLDPAHVMERHTPTGRWLDWFFVVDQWDGEPVNNEPDKCGALVWLQPDDPSVSDYVALALRHIGEGVPFSTYEGT